MLTVDFNKKIGTYTSIYGGISLECAFYDSNCLLAGFTAAKEPNLVIADKEHLVNCSDLLPRTIKNVRLNTYYKNMVDVALILVQMGIEVTLYHEKPQI